MKHFSSAISVVGVVALSTTLLAAEAAKSPELHGYCPAAYGLMGKAIKGDSKHSSTYKGRLYNLANADVKKAFAQKRKLLSPGQSKCLGATPI